MPQHLIRFDWAIKKLLRSKANFGILEGFLSELLKRDLKILNILESESNKNNEDDKFNRVDILVQLGNGELVLIEVQVDSEVDYFHRMLFGTSKIVTEYIKKGEKYKKIKKVYSINILYFDLGHGSDYIYHGTTSFIGIHDHDKLDLNKQQKEAYQKEYIHDIYPEYFLIKVNQFNDIAKDTLDEWIYFLKNEAIKDNFRAKGLLEAKEQLDELKLSPEERIDYEKYLDGIRYKNSMLDSSFQSGKFEGREEGKIEGEKIGIEKGERIGIEKGERIGIEKGKLEGEQIGIEKGEKVGLKKTAKRMQEAGMTKEVIQQITGLDMTEINEL